MSTTFVSCQPHRKAFIVNTMKEMFHLKRIIFSTVKYRKYLTMMHKIGN